MFKRFYSSRWVQLSAFSLLSVLVLFGAYYFVYVDWHSDQLAEYRLKVLSEAGRNAEDEIDRLRGNVANAVRKIQAKDGYEWKKETIKGALDLIPGLLYEAVPTSQLSDGSSQETHLTRDQFEEVGGIPSLGAELVWRGGRTVIQFIGTMPHWRGMEFRAWADLEKHLIPVLPREDVDKVTFWGKDTTFILKDFDNLILAREDRKVLFNVGQEPLLELNTLPLPTPKKTRKTGDAEDPVQQEDFSELSSRTQVVDVKIAGTPYKMFLQPIRVPVEIWYEPSDKLVREETWILAGLEKAPKFRTQAMSISPSVILAVTGLLLIALLALPFLKVQFIGIREGLKGHDVFVLVVALLVASSIITYGVLELLMNGQARTNRDENLESLSGDIETTLLDEIDSLDRQLRRITEEKLAKQSSSSERIQTKNILGQDSTGRYTIYPFFEMVYWMDSTGQQIEKWSVKDETTALINVSDRKYFSQALDRDLWKKSRKKAAKEGSPENIDDKTCAGLCIESIRSKNTGEVFAVLSHRLIHTDKTQPVVAAIISPLLSAIKPAVPPGYGFCIIEENGSVLFHFDETRNLRENLFHWVNVKDQIRAAMFSKTDSKADVTYRAEPYRFYIKPLHGTPWFLIVFAKKDPFRNTRIEIVLFSLLLYSFYLFVLLVSFVCLHYARSAIGEPGQLRSPFEWFWPSREKVGLYIKTALAGLTVICIWLFLMVFWFPIQAIISTVLFAVLCFTSAYAMLLEVDVFDVNEKQSRRLSLGFALALFFTLGIVLASNILNLGYWAILIILLLAFVCIASLRHLLKSMFWIVTGLILLETGYCFFNDAVLVGLAGLFVLIIYYFLIQWQPRSENLAAKKKHWKTWFVTSALSLVVVLSILPPVEFYRAVHDEVITLFTKRQQLEFTKRLQKRAEQKFDRYRNVDMAGIHSRKMEELLYPKISGDTVELGSTWDIYTERGWRATEYSGASRSDIANCEQPILKKLGDMMPGFTRLGQQLRKLTETESYRDTSWIDSCAWYWALKSNKSLTLSMPRYLRDRQFGKSRQSDTLQNTYANLELVSPVAYFSLHSSWQWLLAAILILGVLWVAIRLTVFRLFQLNMLQPILLGGSDLPESKYPPHTLILRGEHPEDLLRGENVHVINSSELRWKPNVTELVEEAKTSEEKTISVENFHDGLGDPRVAERKLQLIERLLTLKDKRIIIKSEINPLHYFNMLSADYHRGVIQVCPDLSRWAMVLASFTRSRNPLEQPDVKTQVDQLTRELIKLRMKKGVLGPQEDSEDKRKQRDRILEYFATECWPDPYLVEIARRFACHPDLLSLNDRRHVVAQVLDMAEAYYQQLWTISGKDEKMVLYRLCREGGFVSWQSREIVRRLIHRGLILIAPHFRPMNESFRRFVIRAELPEVFASWEKEAGLSPWSKLKVPLITAAVILLGFFFATQQDVFQEILAVVAALAVGAPAIIKIVATLLQSRSASGADS